MINNIVVIGSGVMGRGIAYVSALGGFQVSLYDTNEAALKNAQNELDKIFDKGLSRGKMTADRGENPQSITFHMYLNWKTVASQADLGD